MHRNFDGNKTINWGPVTVGEWQAERPTIQASPGQIVAIMVTRVMLGASLIVTNSTVPKLQILTTRSH